MSEGKTYMDVEDLHVYQRLCELHIEVCDLSHNWPQEERYELGSQVRRSSNSSPAQLAEKHDDRHIRNKIEGVNRSRGEAGDLLLQLLELAVVRRAGFRSGPLRGFQALLHRGAQGVDPRQPPIHVLERVLHFGAQERARFGHEQAYVLVRAVLGIQEGIGGRDGRGRLRA